MKVLGLASYPLEAAATRYRLQQFVDPLAKQGINLTVSPFISSSTFAKLYQRRALPRTALTLLKSTLLRLGVVRLLRQSDVVLVQREAMIFGPPVFEWLAARVFKRPLVLDLDDATYVPYTSPTYGKFGRALKWFDKTDDLIRWANVVTCGNRAIADYAESKGATARIIPTVVDTNVFAPRPRTSDGSPALVLGWIGTHSTFPYLQAIFPVLLVTALPAIKFGVKWLLITLLLWLLMLFARASVAVWRNRLCSLGGISENALRLTVAGATHRDARRGDVHRHAQWTVKDKLGL
jgi:hypothetical protein